MRCSLLGALAVGIGGASPVLLSCTDPLPDLGRPRSEGRGGEAAPGVSFVDEDAGTDAAADGAPSATGTSPHAPESPEVPPDPEPQGDPALTIVHGVIDAKLVYLCRTQSGQESSPEADIPLPRGGLRYGERWVVGPSEFDFGREQSLWLIAAETPLADGARCRGLIEGVRAASNAGSPARSSEAGTADTPEDAGRPNRGDASGIDASEVDASGIVGADVDASEVDASGIVGAALDASGVDAGSSDGDAATLGLSEFDVPPLRVAAFATLLAGQLSDEHSTLLVAAGCVGEHVRPGAALCGPHYARGYSTLEPILVRLSRLDYYDSLGLQFVNASGLGRATLRSDPEALEGAVYFTVGSDVVPGEIAPRSSRTGVALDKVGDPIDGVTLRVELGVASEPVFRTTWGAVLEAAPWIELRDGESTSFVLIGPAWPLEQALRDAGFNDLGLVLIDNDPRKAGKLAGASSDDALDAGASALGARDASRASMAAEVRGE